MFRSGWHVAVALACVAPRVAAAAGEPPTLLQLEVPAGVSTISCLPVVVPLLIANVSGRALRVARPDGYWTVRCSFADAPASAWRGRQVLNALPLATPAGAIQLAPGDALTFRLWLDGDYPGALLPGDYEVSIAYQPAPAILSGCEPSPELAGVVVRSEPVRVEVRDPAEPAARAALDVLLAPGKAHWTGLTPSGARMRGENGRAVLYPRTLGSISDLPDIHALLRELNESDEPAVIGVRHRLGDRTLAEATAAATAGRLKSTPLEEFYDDLNAVLDRPPLPTGGQRSPTSIAALAQPELFSPTLTNRLLLEDAMPGVLEPSLVRLCFDFRDTPYASTGAYLTANAYASLGEYERALAWLDWLETEFAPLALEAEASALRCNCLLRLGRVDEARTLADRLTDHWFTWHSILARERR